MKKFGKILALVLTVAVLACAFILVASAGEKNTTDPFIVNGAYYASWKDASGASKLIGERDDASIYLNPDYYNSTTGKSGEIPLSAAWVMQGAYDTTLDLNGCTVVVDDAVATAFGSAQAGYTFTLKGEGTIVNAGTFFRVANGGKLNIVGVGRGITVCTRSFEDDYVSSGVISDHKSVKPSIFINASEGTGSEISVTGNFTVKPYNGGGTIFKLTGTNVKFTAVGANIVVEKPASEYQRKYDAKGALATTTQAFEFGTGSCVKIDDSHVEVQYGDMFVVNSSVASAEIKVYIYKEKLENALHNGEVGSFINDVSTTEMADPTITLDVDDSTIIACEGYYIDRSILTRAPNFYVGSIMVAGKAALYASFDNCDIVGAERAFTAYSYRPERNATSSTVGKLDVNYTNMEIPLKGGTTTASTEVGISGITGSHLIFNNCNYSTSEDVLQTSPWLGGDYINIKWNGGVFSLKSPYYSNGEILTQYFGGMFSYSYAYGTLADNNNGYDDDWYGVQISNIYSEGNVDAPRSATITGACYSYLGTRYDNVKVLPYGETKGAINYVAAFLDKAYVAPAPAYTVSDDVDTTRTSVYNPTSSSSSYSSVGAYDGILAPAFANRIGMIHNVSVKDGFGNGYAKAQINEGDEVGSQKQASFLDISINGFGNFINSSNKSTNSLTFASQTEFEAATIANNPKDVYLMKYIVKEFDVATDCGAYAYTTVGQMNRAPLVKYENGTYTVTATEAANGASYATIYSDGKINMGGVVRQLPLDGSWSRISIVYEIKYTETTLAINGKSYPAYNFSGTKAHMYLNGEYVSSINCIADRSFVQFLAEAFTIDSIRMWFYPETGKLETSAKTLSTCVDNIYTAKYYADDADKIASIAASVASGESIKGKAYLYNMPENTIKTVPVANVDGVDYGSMDEALQAVRPGSNVTLYTDYTETIDVNFNFNIDTNGHNVGGFTSEDYVAVVRDGVIGFTKAESHEKFEISFRDSVNSIDEKAYATVGSLVKIPANANTDLYPDANEGRYLVGWSFSAESETLTVASAYDADKDGKIDILPVYVDAAVVEWYDNEGNLLHTENYKPGDGVLSAVYTPTVDIPGVTTAHAWFDLAYKGYSAIELPTSGTYEVYPDMEPTAKSAMPANIKLNLTLFTNYELNIFVPLTNLPDEIAKDSIRVVRLSGADNEQAVGSLGECTVYSEPYIKFGGDKYGVADTSINTYRIYYKADGVELYKELSYGVPYYASAVMQQSTDNEARTLVMNMVNYASKVIAGLSVDKTGDRGAEIYNALLEKEEFAALVRTYDDSAFLENGAIWNADIKNLTYDDVIADDPETTEFDESLKSPSKWISGGGFYFSTNQPRFFIKFSGTAEMTANGIKKPDSLGKYGWADPGLFGYIGMTGEAVRPGRLYARYDDTGADAYSDWNNKDKSGNITYYLVGTSYDAKNPFRLYNMAEPLSVKLNSHSGPNNSSAVYYPDQGDDIVFTYSLAAYIEEMITKANNETLSTEARAEYRAAADMAKALYAYAKVTREFVY